MLGAVWCAKGQEMDTLSVKNGAAINPDETADWNDISNPAFVFSVGEWSFLTSAEDSLTLAMVNPDWIESISILNPGESLGENNYWNKDGAILIGLKEEFFETFPTELKKKFRGKN